MSTGLAARIKTWARVQRLRSVEGNNTNLHRVNSSPLWNLILIEVQKNHSLNRKYCLQNVRHFALASMPWYIDYYRKLNTQQLITTTHSYHHLVVLCSHLVLSSAHSLASSHLRVKWASGSLPKRLYSTKEYFPGLGNVLNPVIALHPGFLYIKSTHGVLPFEKQDYFLACKMDPQHHHLLYVQ